MAVKKIIMKQKKNGTFDVLHPETEMSQIVDWQGGNGGVVKVIFDVRTERHPLLVNYSVEYVDSAIIHCSKSIEEINQAVEGSNVVIGIIRYPGNIIVEGYYYNGNWYEDAQHSIEITPDTDKIYIDKESGAGYGLSYRYNPARYEEIAADDLYEETGYYNPQDGKFYSDSSFTQEMPAYENVIYKDLASNKKYAYIAACYIDTDSMEKILIEYKHLQIPLVSAPGMNNVRFQILISDAELTINGRRLQNLEDYYDSWSLNYSEGIYQLSGSMSQVVTSKSNTYPSCAAVKAYVDEAISNLQ